MNQANKLIIEPFPQKIAEISELLSRLSQEEQYIEANRRNRNVRRQHKRQAENLRQQLLAQADYSLVYNYLEATSLADKDAFRTTWQNNLPPIENQGWIEVIQNYPLDLTPLPFGSFHIQFEFTLLKPYISRDDNDFYIIDNPIVRDKVFRYPMVRPTAWKGALRHALWQLEHDEEDNDQIQRLFGSANDEDDSGKRGRLYFYPSFFTQTGLEILNPHDRERRVGKNPILIESVPQDAAATFTLLYTPLDCIGGDKSETRRQTFADLELVAQGLEAMFTVYGFGAKTSSGYGVAGEDVAGKLELNYPDPDFVAPQRPSAPTLPKAVASFRQKYGDKYPDEAFQEKPKAWRKQHGATNKERGAYKKARKAYRRYRKEEDQYTKALAAWEKEMQKPRPQQTERAFQSFSMLHERIEQLTQSFRGEEK
jgi:CRISPR-associated protein Cmr2